jgi:uncharacterized membrane protein YphA (DoxX/SURF4 family)
MIQIDKKTYYTLRFASAMCFIGHGAFGIITKPVWCNYFAVFGIGQHMAYNLMPVLGIVDILLGISLLIYPVRAVAAWLVIWGLVTALLRPLSGESVAEFIERAGNYGAPLALLTMYGSNVTTIKKWFRLLNPVSEMNEDSYKRLITCLKFAVFLLLAGHGWLNLIEKKGLMSQYTSLGFIHPVRVAHIVGLFELLSALTVLIRPMREVLFFLLIWKMGTELFYPHWEVFEWIERGGSYGVLLALFLALPKPLTMWQRSPLAA